jgi:hypothetical protein
MKTLISRVCVVITLLCLSIHVSAQQSPAPSKAAADTTKFKVKLQYFSVSSFTPSFYQTGRPSIRIDLGKRSRIVEYRLQRNRHLNIDDTSLGRTSEVPYHLMDNRYPR